MHSSHFPETFKDSADPMTWAADTPSRTEEGEAEAPEAGGGEGGREGGVLGAFGALDAL
jgi:hypothetical protein